ncbi:thiamine pyrophosphate-dependent enzyme [Spirulina sp. 06S082]|uniref:thiamine pyrophosphate-dependent enzyme n=1 Tax=Spirulina sp. 06S082 TaxID=3110248 RepID=UPI002B20B0DA|nr:thiamine pyrophosphate-dependent enzyme [Spirulina sp. 06S082]MEA5472067.1 thiamine pyrophosphate-dependent enzyme [Spirulina sp. 06S082]
MITPNSPFLQKHPEIQLPLQSTPTSVSVAEAVVTMLRELGVEYAFGVSGGAIAPLWSALEASKIQVLHFRHETGAAFAAAEAYFASDRPVVIFTTTGPGLTNAITGLLSARWEGAKVIFISPSTSSPQRGRWAFQETSGYTMPVSGLFTSGSLFHYAHTLESGEELPQVSRRLEAGLNQPGGFVAHVSIPTGIQSSPTKALPAIGRLAIGTMTASEAEIAQAAELLSEGEFAIWVGFGARKAAGMIRQLAERSGAPVMCSARGKGVFPEDHSQFLGVTGFGGHGSVLNYMQEYLPKRVLVLGTRLGEFTSFWSPMMVPEEGGFIHVDLDPTVFGVAYPHAETLGICSDIGAFVTSLLKYFPEGSHHSPRGLQPEPLIAPSLGQSPIHPEVLMAAIQAVIVDGSDAVVMTEAGNSFAWGTHTLRFAQPDRYRTSMGFGSMGHAGTGVLGAALGRNGKAVAILGDGSMLMNSEVSTAVQYGIPAVWIVLNDSHYNMCHQGMRMLGHKHVDANIPDTDFAAIARAMGAEGVRIKCESEVREALQQAMQSQMPVVLDVRIDPSQKAPIGSRIKSLKSQEKVAA